MQHVTRVFLIFLTGRLFATHTLDHTFLHNSQAAANFAGTLQQLNSVLFYPLHIELIYILNVKCIHS